MTKKIYLETLKSVLGCSVLHYSSGLGNGFLCKRFAAQTLLWSLEFVTLINLKHNTIAV